MKIENLKNRLRKALKIQFFRDGRTISYVEAKNILNENSMAILIDVRSIQEYNEYHLNGAICIPTYDFKEKVSNIIEDKEQPIILYCQSGTRSKKAANILRNMGYTNIYELDGGIENI